MGWEGGDSGGRPVPPQSERGAGGCAPPQPPASWGAAPPRPPAFLGLRPLEPPKGAPRPWLQWLVSFRLTESLAHRGSPTHTPPSPRPLTPSPPTLVNTTSFNRSDHGQFMFTEGRARARAQGPGPGPGPWLGVGGGGGELWWPGFADAVAVFGIAMLDISEFTDAVAVFGNGDISRVPTSFGKYHSQDLLSLACMHACKF